MDESEVGGVTARKEEQGEVGRTITGGR